jgi:hypothetical protein
MKISHLAAVTLPALLLAGNAGAFRQPDSIKERPFEAARGTRARATRIVHNKAPRALDHQWAGFVSKYGDWRAIWDTETGVPLRMYGKGVDAPGSVADAGIAQAAATRMLREQLALLAPGASFDDLKPLANVLHGDGTMRTVSFQETRHGMPVHGAAVNFLFKNDRLFVIGSTASPAIAVTKPADIVAEAGARENATAWIHGLYGGDPRVLSVGAPEWLPLVRERGGVELVATVPVVVDLEAPRGRWTVWVNAKGGAPVAREQMLRFAQGTLKYHVGVRRPGGATQDYPALYASHQIAGQTVTADLAGLFTWTGNAAASVTARVLGTYVAINNAAGSEVTQAFTVQPGGSATWDLIATE